jgi:hypothetical protein
MIDEATGTMEMPEVGAETAESGIASSEPEHSQEKSMPGVQIISSSFISLNAALHEEQVLQCATSAGKDSSVGLMKATAPPSRLIFTCRCHLTLLKHFHNGPARIMQVALNCSFVYFRVWLISAQLKLTGNEVITFRLTFREFFNGFLRWLFSTPAVRLSAHQEVTSLLPFLSEQFHFSGNQWRHSADRHQPRFKSLVDRTLNAPEDPYKCILGQIHCLSIDTAPRIEVESHQLSVAIGQK